MVNMVGVKAGVQYNTITSATPLKLLYTTHLTDAEGEGSISVDITGHNERKMYVRAQNKGDVMYT